MVITTSAKIKVFADDRIVQPQTPFEAKKSGWHCGLIYDFYNFDYDKLESWCRETFMAGTYAVFTGSVWFVRKSDAVLCKLKWA